MKTVIFIKPGMERVEVDQSGFTEKIEDILRGLEECGCLKLEKNNDREFTVELTEVGNIIGLSAVMLNLLEPKVVN